MADSNRVTETRDVRSVRRVSLNGVGVLVITQGDDESLTIEADEQVMPRITTRVEDGTLLIGLESGSWWQRLTDAMKKIRYDLSVREITGITLAGTGKIEASGILAERLDLAVSGAGKLRVDALKATDLSVVVSGAGSCETSGSVENQDVKITGAGGYKAPDLKSCCAKTLLSGTGSITVNVEETLDAIVSGAGSIKYHGEPTVFQRIPGVGSIRGLDLRPE
jgi:hypothetical protein